MPALEAFGTIALRVAHSEFWITNIQQPGGTSRLRVARGIVARDCAFGLHVSILYVHRRPGQSSGIAARSRVSCVYLRSIAVRSSVSGMLQSSIVFIAARGRV